MSIWSVVNHYFYLSLRYKYNLNPKVVRKISQVTNQRTIILWVDDFEKCDVYIKSLISNYSIAECRVKAVCAFSSRNT